MTTMDEIRRQIGRQLSLRALIRRPICEPPAPRYSQPFTDPATVPDMKVPLTSADFLARAEAVYGDRIGVVDEPDQPGLARRADLRRAGRPGARTAGRSRRARRRRRRAGRGRLPEHRPAARAALRRTGVRPDAGADQLPAALGGGRVHRRALRRVGAAGRPRARRGAARRHRQAPLRARRGQRRGAARAPIASRCRGPDIDEDATATINYTSGTTARPKGVQITHRNIWTNAVTFGLHAGVTDRDVYLHTLPMFHAQRLGDAVHDGRARRTAGRAAQGRRRRDPAPGREVRRDLHVRGAGGAHRGARRRAGLDGPIPGRDRVPGSSSPVHRRRPRRSRGSRTSSAGSSSRSTGSPRPRRC